MKYLKVTFLFFLIFSLFQFTSCNNKERIEISKIPSLDSVSIYIQRMRDTSFGNSICLSNANKALKIEKKTNPNSKRYEEILNYKIYLLGNLKHLDSAINSSKELLQLTIKKNDSAAIGNNYSRFAYYYSQNYKNYSAFLIYKLSKEIHLNLGDSAKVGENLAQMAIIQSDLGDYTGSDNTAIQALKYLDKNNIQYLTAIYNCIAISARKQKDYIEAIYWYNKAIDISTSEIDKISYLNNKANAYRSLKDYDNSIIILKKLIKNTLLNNDTKVKTRVIDNLAFTRWLAHNNENVLNDLVSAMTIRLQENDLFGLIASYAHLSDYYKHENPRIALEYATKMHNLSINLKSPQDQLEAMQKLIELETSNKAKEYYSNYIKLNDSINEAEKNTLNKFVKLKYDSEKNREENLQLKISTSEKELELEKEKTKSIITYTTGGSLFLVLLIFMYNRKQKHKLEKRAEVYKTEKRIAKKIHDEVANNVVNIMNKVQYTENPKNELLDDLEKVYLLTRNISHENNAIETGEKFEYFLKTMLTSFNTTKTTIILKDIHKVALAEIAKEKQIELYRILQELMVNMRKHSEASLVAITFQNIKNNYSINYSDNGIGLNLEELTFQNGLNNVETRIKSLNGTVTFETALNNGFKAFISFKN
ncbi:MAG: tetratricopeptide repeat-containing sensor histidine kinase [Lutibacter sp.]